MERVRWMVRNVVERPCKTLVLSLNPLTDSGQISKSADEANDLKNSFLIELKIYKNDTFRNI